MLNHNKKCILDFKMIIILVTEDELFKLRIFALPK